ncbi:MAG: hypothetical protein PVF58_05375 [Candidatus Methanofastidiosia archaeon]|jgi:hypothetical protein
MIHFGLTAMLAIIPAVVGIYLSTYTVFEKVFILGIWMVYAGFFFTIWESRIICNHCPYYANDAENVLHCPIDKGKPKTYYYDPGPLSTSEKYQFMVGAIILIGYFQPFLILGGQLLYMGLSIGGVCVWVLVCQKKVCTDCINFACPLNRVPKIVRDQFLNRNPVIKKAWEEKGYQISSE